MASFVREVLSATKQLREKEDFAGKALRLKRRVDDLKSNLRQNIEARYVEFSASYVEVSTAVGQFEDVLKEIETLEHSISTHFKHGMSENETSEIVRQMKDLRQSVLVGNLARNAFHGLSAAEEHLGM